MVVAGIPSTDEQARTMKHAVWWIVAVALLTLAVAYPPSVVMAEDPLPPAVGMTILEDPLSGPTLIQPLTCQSGRAGFSYVGEGLRLKATGVCSDGETVASIGPIIRGLTIADGEIRLEVKAVSGLEHVRFTINTRNLPVTPGSLNPAAAVPASYAVAIEPALGRAMIGKVGSQILERDDLANSLSADDWNTVAIRLQGPNFWLLLNDQPVLFFSDDSLDHGDVSFSVLKLSDGPERSVSDPNDPNEAAVIVRNLRVSALADGDPARVPVYERR
jgi:hypothetical protein